ncbi:recombinase family protein [Tundrisphaera sp. TA3]|uniref:recombinase family protein n=1 Tax=Tundrisphaera sp. TA3 TaxID=3435775 RepID=UPI003EBD3E13
MNGKLIAYYRVSTLAQGRSGLGLEAQETAVADYAKAYGKEVIKAYQETESGKDNDRPELMKAMAHARRAGATLCIAKLDRLSRNMAFLANLMETKVPFVCCDMPEASEITLHLMAAFAQYERKAISSRTKAALAAYKARGGLLGASHPNGVKITQEARLEGSRVASKRRSAEAAAAYADLTPMMLSWRAGGMTQSQIAERLTLEGHTTRSGKSWSQGQVSRVLQRMA